MYSTVYKYLLFALLSGHPTVIINGFPPEDKINCSPFAISSVSIFAFIILDATCSACKFPKLNANKIRFSTADIEEQLCKYPFAIVEKHILHNLDDTLEFDKLGTSWV